MFGRGRLSIAWPIGGCLHAEAETNRILRHTGWAKAAFAPALAEPRTRMGRRHRRY
jgi:hypothetical protein